jgi:predicted lipid-binding transport protein (Tim44 family)
MVTRAEILILGLTSGVVGSLVGGLMLGVGLGLAVNGAHIGWLLVLPAAPVAGVIGYMLARKLAKQLPEEPR